MLQTLLESKRAGELLASLSLPRARSSPAHQLGGVIQAQQQSHLAGAMQLQHAQSKAQAAQYHAQLQHAQAQVQAAAAPGKKSPRTPRKPADERPGVTRDGKTSPDLPQGLDKMLSSTMKVLHSEENKNTPLLPFPRRSPHSRARAEQQQQQQQQQQRQSPAAAVPLTLHVHPALPGGHPYIVQQLGQPAGPFQSLPSFSEWSAAPAEAAAAAAAGQPPLLYVPPPHATPPGPAGAAAAKGKRPAAKRKPKAAAGAGVKKNSKPAKAKAKASPRGEKRKAVKSTSKYRGVTHHCRTGRWEAHIWEDGKQVYLGGFNKEDQAALAHDLVAIKCRGPGANLNFDFKNYERNLPQLESVTKDELILSLRRQSRGDAKGSSRFRGVTKHQKGKWEARIGQSIGKKYRYLGLFKEEEDAARAYDTEAVKQRGLEAITNFPLRNYVGLLQADEQLFLKQRGGVAPTKDEAAQFYKAREQPAHGGAPLGAAAPPAAAAAPAPQTVARAPVSGPLESLMGSLEAPKAPTPAPARAFGPLPGGDPLGPLVDLFDASPRQLMLESPNKVLAGLVLPELDGKDAPPGAMELGPHFLRHL